VNGLDGKGSDKTIQGLHKVSAGAESNSLPVQGIDCGALRRCHRRWHGKTRQEFLQKYTAISPKSRISTEEALREPHGGVRRAGRPWALSHSGSAIQSATACSDTRCARPM